MEIKGTKTDYLEIDVDERDIIDAAISILKQRNKKLIPYNYIGDDGYWYEWEYDSPHNGDPEYDRKRKATKEEKEFDKFLQKLDELFEED